MNLEMMKDMNKYVMPQTEVDMLEGSLLIMQQVSGSGDTLKGIGEHMETTDQPM